MATTEELFVIAENDFIFSTEINNFEVQIKQIITKHLQSQNQEKIFAAHNLDFFLMTHNCFTSFDVQPVDWNGIFLDYQASNKFQNSIKTINLDSLLTRFESHFKESL